MHKTIDVNLVTQGEYLSGGVGGIGRYCREQVKNIKRIAPADSRVKTTSIVEGRYLGMLETKVLGLSFKPVSKITHNLTERPLTPIRRRETVLVNTAHEFQRILYPEITKTEGRLVSEMPGHWLKMSYMWDMLKGDCIIATSSQTKEEARKLGFDGDIFVVGLGVGREFFRTAKSRSSGKGFIIGYIGAIRKRKGINMLIDSMNYLDSGFGLKMYGRIFNRYNDEFNMLMKNAKNSKYCGVVSSAGLVDVYDSFDAIVMPSEYEGFGLGILEAQARGLPVIVNGKGKIPKETTRYCLRADNAEEVARLLSRLKDRGYNSSKKKAAMDYARSFTWRKTAKETIDVYQRLI